MRMTNCLAVTLIALLATTACTACRDKDKSLDSDQPRVIRSNDELKPPTPHDSIAGAERLKQSLNIITNEINDCFDDITHFEQALDTTQFSQLPQNKRARLRNNILQMKNDIQEKRKQLTSIENELDNIDDASKGDLAIIINNLRQQLNLQKQRIDHLWDKLHSPVEKAQTAATDSLMAASHPTETTQAPTIEKPLNNEQDEMLSDEANQCFYTSGTREELTSRKIINSEFLKKTKVMQSSNILATYFTKADKRTLNEVTIHSKNVTLLTNHDAQSFSIVVKNDNTVITILNPALFWEYSNYLVVLTQ